MEVCDCLINQPETGYYSHITCDVEATGTLQLISQHMIQVKYSTVGRRVAMLTQQHSAPYQPQASADCSVGGLHSTGLKK